MRNSGRKAAKKMRCYYPIESHSALSSLSRNQFILSPVLSWNGKKRNKDDFQLEGVDFLQGVKQFLSVRANKRCLPEPFKAAFVDAVTREEGERIFRLAFSEKEAQIDKIQTSKFCTLVIYHDPKIPTI